MKWEFEIIKIGLSLVFGYIVHLLGGYDPMLNLLIVIVIADVVTGFSTGLFITGLDSEIMYRGAFKKIAIFIVIVVAVQIDIALNNVAPLREMVIIYYIGQEGISFVENIGNFVTLPEKLTQFFKNIGKDEGRDEY